MKKTLGLFNSYEKNDKIEYSIEIKGVYHGSYDTTIN